MNRILNCGLFWVMIMLAACSNDKRLDKMERIKEIGDENPQEALLMLDSLRLEVRDWSDYAKSKYDMLQIRLNDKIGNPSTSDLVMKKLLDYFEDKGSQTEKQEVHFYAGCVYRDLQDTPRSLENFLSSLRYAKDNAGSDSAMLCDTYANLFSLQYKVQNYNDAAKMAERETVLCRRLKRDMVLPFLHLSAAYIALSSYRHSVIYLDSAYVYVSKSDDVARYQDELVYLLNNYSNFGLNIALGDEVLKARKCFSLIKNNPLIHFDALACMAFARYYELRNKVAVYDPFVHANDSAKVYCQRVLDDGTSRENMFDAAKMLFQIYRRQGDAAKANGYADVYMQLSDSMDFGKRQELAATVNNQYKYHLDKKTEQDLKEEKERYRNMLVMVLLAAMLLAAVGYILYIKKRNRHLRQVLAMSSELQKLTDNEKQMNDMIEQRERQLEERRAQNKRLVNQLHQAELAEKAEDVIESIRLAAVGKKSMSSADWKQLYKAVDELYPELKEKLLEQGTLTEQQMNAFYLMKIGFTNTQIQNLTGFSRVTIWRWIKKFGFVTDLKA